jgi:MFS family permease
MSSSKQAFGAKQITLVGLLFLFSVMSYFDRTIMSIAGPQIMKEFGVAPTQMGSIYSAFILGYIFLMVPGGQLVDRLGPRATLTIMSLAAALFTGLTAVGGKPGLGTYVGVVPGLIAIRFLMGAGTSPLYPACGAVGSHWIPPARQARVQGLIISGSSLGGAVSPMIFSRLMAQYGWRGSFWIAAAATAILGLIWYWYARDYPARGAAKAAAATTTPGEPKVSAWRLLTNRNLLLTTLAYFTLGYFEFVFYYWIYYYFGEIRHLGYEQSARYTTGLFLTMAVMMPTGGWISDRISRAFGARIGRRIVPMVALTTASLLLFLGTRTAGTITTVTLLSLAIGFASFCEGPFWSIAIETSGSQVGGACGVLNFGGNLGGFFAPVLTPFIASHAGWSWGLYAGSLLVLAGAVACYFVDLGSGSSPAHIEERVA